MPRRFQFSLTGLLATMLVIAAVFVDVGYIYRLSERPIVVPAPVSGILTINGRSTPDWEVTFFYTAFDGMGTTADGVTGAGGNFTLSSPLTTPPGVWPGEYSVGFRPASDYEWIGLLKADTSKWYADPETSGIKVIVKAEGPNRFRFDLTQPK